MRNLYKVESGTVTQVETIVTVDWQVSALVCADTPEQALVASAAYDAGQLAPDNIDWHGETIAALRA